MMLKRMLLLIVMLCLGAGVLHAQDGDSRRDIYTVLAYGDDVFEPELWLAGAQESVSRATATWSSDELGGLAFADYLYFADGFSSLEDVFDEEWFLITLENYDSWKLNHECAFDDSAELRVFDVTSNDLEYTMHYWTRVEDETHLLAFFLVIPKDQPDVLAEYSERFAPTMASCEDA